MSAGSLCLAVQEPSVGNLMCQALRDQQRAQRRRARLHGCFYQARDGRGEGGCMCELLPVIFCTVLEGKSNTARGEQMRQLFQDVLQGLEEGIIYLQNT